MIREFRLPDVGEGVAEGELVEWLVEPGESVTEDQPVAEVETDKALVEIPSPYDGTVHELRAEPGEVVPVGEVIISFDVPEEAVDDGAVEGEAKRADEATGETDAASEAAGDGTAADGADGADDAPATRPGGPVAPPSVRRLARELGVALDAVAGSGPGGRVTEADVRAAAEGTGAADDGASAASGGDGGGATPEPRAFEPGSLRSAVSARAAGETDETGDDGDAADDAGAAPAGRERTLAAPATRRLAEEEGVDIDDVPTDETRDGEAFVTPEQVRAYAARATGADAAGEPASGAGTGDGDGTEAGAGGDAAGADGTGTDAGAEQAGRAPAEGGGAGPSGERVPYRGVRRTIGERMERAKFTAPHVTHHDSVDATELVALREELNEAASVRLTYLPLVTKAVVAALREFPYVNAQLDEEAGEIVLRDEYNVGVATATDAGLMVPVVENADAKGLEALATEIAERTERARERSISPEELRGGTFTITNVGTIGGEYATPIVNYPEVAVLALGAIRERPRVVGGEVVPRHTLPLSLSVDHRVVDGAVAARFTNRVKELLETPSRLLLELE